MADFRKWFYALAVIAVLTALAVPAAAQNPPFQCVANAAVPPIVRAEGYTELVGDLTLNCTGGVPTPAGSAVPQVNVTVFLQQTNITSKILQGSSSQNGFNEALLIIDEPNSAVNPARPILNCGNTGAPDGGPSGPGVCEIFATSTCAAGLGPICTYDGTPSVKGTAAGDTAAAACTTFATSGIPNANCYGIGRPNVFQGRAGTVQNAGQFNATTWNGVPLDPPGTTTNRTIRITNVRANAVAVGVSSTFTTATIVMSISVNGNTSLSINNPQQIVAFVQRGLLGGVQQSQLNFIQCVSENPSTFTGTGTTFLGSQGANLTQSGAPSFANTPLVRFIEGFASSWKVKNLAFDLGSGSGNTIQTGNANFNAATNFYVYNGATNYPTSDAWQNVPGAIYNTESGFEFSGTTANSVPGSNPSPNPPQGFGTTPVSANAVALASQKLNNTATDTGIAGAGVASQGTRLAISFTNIPQGSSVFVPPIIYLNRQFTNVGTPTTAIIAPQPGPSNTGVMVLTNTSSVDGSGSFSRATTGSNLQQVSNGLAVYEILYADPFSLEYADVPVVVAFVSNLSQNLPQVGVTAQAAIGFAPFFSSQAAGQPQTGATSGVGSVPRFVTGQGPQNLFLISKCACNILYPYVVSTAGFDTGIALANTSLDPGPTFGFGATPQSGTVTFFYFGLGANNTAPPAAQTTNKVVPAGQVLTYVASSGNADFGLDNRAAGFVGYVITQAQFQWCHAFAFIGALGAGAVTPGVGTISEGYLGLQIDLGGLNRTSQASEMKSH
jgi:hypothetical protein